MKTRGVHLQYSFLADGQRGADLHNPLFELLGAVREGGSIQHAARALGASYRHVWGQLKHWEEVLGEPLVGWTQGQPARLTPFAERLLWAEARARTRMTPHIEALRAELERVLAEALDGGQQELPVWAGHDLALPRLCELAREDQRLHLALRTAGSLEALRALGEGRCSVATLPLPVLPAPSRRHAEALEPLLSPRRHRLLRAMRRTQGLMTARGNPLGLRRLADLPARGARVVQRPPGSATRLLADHLVAAEGLAAADWAGCAAGVEDSHVAVAAAVASGLADAGLGIEAAARAFGLHFVPLAEEEVFFAFEAGAADQPALQALQAVLAGPAWRAALAALPGYGAQGAGQVLAPPEWACERSTRG